MFKEYATTGIEKILNHCLGSDPDYKTYIAPLQGKILKIQIAFPPLSLLLQFSADTIKVLPYYHDTPDCTITGSSFALLQSALNEKAGTWASNKIHLSGQTDVAQDFSALCHRINIDWEEMLSEIIGDSCAHAAGNILRSTLANGHELSQRWQNNLQEYIKHESKCFAQAEEINNFLDKIDTLRHDVERLNARLAALKAA